MSCTEIVCGTQNGVWTGPKPGDPDNNLTLRAEGVPDGIQLNWTYPLVNPHALSHVQIFRAITSNFSAATQIAISSSSYYFDSIDDPAQFREYFYWIRVVTINGTTNEVIGPASAVPMDSVSNFLERITGKIEESYLGMFLKEKIANIIDNAQKLTSDFEDSSASDLVLQDALDQVRSATDQALVFIQDEVNTRTSQTEGLLTSVNALAVGLGNNQAAITEEKTLRVTADDALSTRITNLYASTDTSLSAIRTEQTTQATKQTAMATDISTLFTKTDATNALVQTNKTAQATVNSSVATQLTTLTTKTNDNKAAIDLANKAITDNNTALSQSITTVQTNAANNLASVQTTLKSQIDTQTGVINTIYGAKVDVNGLVGGFGISNNGTKVDAGFDVDTFWVGKANLKKKPFYITGGNTYIDAAFIASASIDSAKIKDAAITSAKIGNLQVQSANIAELTVGTNKITGNAVTIVTGGHIEMATGGGPAIEYPLVLPTTAYRVVLQTHIQGVGYGEPMATVYVNGQNLTAYGYTGNMKVFENVGAGTYVFAIQVQYVIADVLIIAYMR